MKKLLVCLISMLKQSVLIVIISLCLFEGIGHIFFTTDKHLFNYRYMFITKGGFRSIKTEKLWTYAPNRQLESSAVYGFPSPYSRFEVEYRCFFETNNLGFIKSTHPYDPAKKTVLILGDSYVEGQGGCNWTPQVEAQFPNFNIVNGGLMSNGVEAFGAVHDYMVENGMKIDHVVMVTIAGDYRRKTHTKWITDNDACLKQGQCTPKSSWVGIDANTPDETLIEIARNASPVRNGVWSLKETATFYIQTYSLTYNIYKLLRTNGMRFPQPPRIEPTIPEPAEEVLKKLKARYPDMAIIMVPRKLETGLVRKVRDRMEVEAYLNKNGYPFMDCPLANSDFMHYDAHPNAKGYQKLAACVNQAIRAFEKQ